MDKHAFHKEHKDATVPIASKLLAHYHEAHQQQLDIDGHVTRLVEITNKLSAIPHPPEDQTQANAIINSQVDMVTAYDALHASLNRQVGTYENIMRQIPHLIGSLKKQHDHLKA